MRVSIEGQISEFKVKKDSEGTPIMRIIVTAEDVSNADVASLAKILEQKATIDINTAQMRFDDLKSHLEKSGE